MNLSMNNKKVGFLYIAPYFKKFIGADGLEVQWA
jgi:hypothetical protein